MTDARSKQFLDQWLAEDHGWVFRGRMKTMAFWHNKVPSIVKPMNLLGLLFRGGLIVSGPAAAVFYGSVELGLAAIVGSLLLAMNMGLAFTGRKSAERQSTDIQSEGSIRFGDLLSTFKPNGIPAKQRSEAIGACLGIIENFVLPVTGAKRGDIAVTLLVYEGTGKSKMRVKSRNPGNKRPVNREVQAKSLLGHHACNDGAAPRVVNHIGHFGKDFATSPTQTKLTYKSILILPLECHTAQGTAIRGFVSIDAARPYAFYGNRANVIVVMCEPIISQLKQLVSGG